LGVKQDQKGRVLKLEYSVELAHDTSVSVSLPGLMGNNNRQETKCSATDRSA